MPINIPEFDATRIVIVGAGFAGLNLAKGLVGSKYQVVLIDENNYHQFQPLLYQVAMAGLEPSSIAFPLRKAFQKKPNITIRCTKVLEIKPDLKRIETESGHVNYDILILAYGTKTNFFNNPNFEKYTDPLKSVSQAVYLRNHILTDFEKALIIRDYSERQNYLDIVIVGGGPTGVEMAGALAEMKKYIIPKDYPELNNEEIDIYLIQGNARLLPTMSEAAGKKAAEVLTKMGVIIKTSTHVIDAAPNKVMTKDATYHCMKVIWAAGVTCHHFPGLENAVTGSSKRLKVNALHQIENYDSMYAIGDVACMIDEKHEYGHPQVAQPAIQQAKNLAYNLKNNTSRPFVYRNLGDMATIGRNNAVADIGRLRFGGFLAWAIWLFVHIASLVGWRNRVIVFINWFWSYFTFDQSLRLIIRPYIREIKKD